MNALDAVTEFHRDQFTGLFSLVELILRMGILFAGKTPPPKWLGGGLRALKFEFFTNAENASMIAPKMRQARTWPPQSANDGATRDRSLSACMQFR